MSIPAWHRIVFNEKSPHCAYDTAAWPALPVPGFKEGTTTMPCRVRLRAVSWRRSRGLPPTLAVPQLQTKTPPGHHGAGHPDRGKVRHRKLYCCRLSASSASIILPYSPSQTDSSPSSRTNRHRVRCRLTQTRKKKKKNPASVRQCRDGWEGSGNLSAFVSAGVARVARGYQTKDQASLDQRNHGVSGYR